jgi:hypothetical protein
MCPKGNFALYAQTDPAPETQAVVITNVFTPGTDARDYKKFNGNGTEDNGEFALTFRSTLNEEFTTFTMNVYNLTEAIVTEALNSLPNKVIEEAEVVLYRNLSKYNATTYARQQPREKNWERQFPYDYNNFNFTWYDTDLVILISYTGAMTTGNQYALECKTAFCDAGCQPKISNPLDFKEHSECYVVDDYKPPNGVNVECSGRGSCDYKKGTCECYEGYTDEYCSTQTALI